MAEYRKFLELKVRVKDWDATQLSPSPALDRIWHEHILDTRRYRSACEALQGGAAARKKLIEHDPDAPDGPEKDARRQATLIAYRAAGWGDPPALWAMPAPVAASVAVDLEPPAKRRRRDAETPITIQVCDSEGKRTIFQLKGGTPLRKLMDAFCRREGYPMEGVRFLFKGERLSREHTPDALGMNTMEEGANLIDALVEHTGC